MRQIACTVILLVCCLIGFGCDKSPVDDAADTLVQGYDKGQKAAAVANLRTLQTAAQQYRVTHGSYPDSIGEVGELVSRPIDTSMYEYDPANGRVRLKED